MKKIVANGGSNIETIFIYDAFGKLAAEYENVAPPTNPQTKYLTTDHLGSPRVVTDRSGNVVSRHDYFAYGEEIQAGLLGANDYRKVGQKYLQADGIRQQFTGYERDSESGLDYAQARYYNSRHGRFTSVDPLTASASIRNPQTFNRYSYALNSPYKFTDPLGLAAVPAVCGGTSEADPCGSMPVSGGETTDPPRPPQHLLAEAMNRITRVTVTGGDQPDMDGIMEIDSTMNEEITNALGDAWNRGLTVGGVGKASNGVLLTVSATLENSVEIGPSITIGNDGVQAGISGSEGKSVSKTVEVSASEAVRMDIKERAQNTVSASNVATTLADTSVTVVTTKGVEKNVITPREFWRKAVQKEINLMYSRGVANGFNNTSAAPAIKHIERKKT